MSLVNIKGKEVVTPSAVVKSELEKAQEVLKAITGLSRDTFEKIQKLTLLDNEFIELVGKLGQKGKKFPLAIYRKRLTGTCIVPKGHPRIKAGEYLAKLLDNTLILEDIKGKGIQSIQLKGYVEGSIGTYIEKVLCLNIVASKAVERKKLSNAIKESFTNVSIDTIETNLQKLAPKVVEYRRNKTALNKGYYQGYKTPENYAEVTKQELAKAAEAKAKAQAAEAKKAAKAAEAKAKRAKAAEEKAQAAEAAKAAKAAEEEAAKKARRAEVARKEVEAKAAKAEAAAKLAEAKAAKAEIETQYGFGIITEEEKISQLSALTV